ncbi:MAG TPA: DPP IV N-terminal domain-containing protein [Gemmataceae bacterium]|nr:DPP IV N-terminal domain-containing protein [Gemmataceae bacterium]
MYERYLKAGEAVKWNPVRPHWLADGNRFWYAAGAPEHTTIYLVDPKAGTRQAMFDVAKVRKALAVALGREPAHAGLPFARFTFAAGETKVRFTAEGKHWELDRAEGTLTEVPAPAGGEAGPRDGEVASPDGRLFVREKDHNVYLRKAGEERARPLTDDGTPDDGWIVRGFDRSPWRARWSPDGSRLATFRVDQRRVPKDPIVHFLKAIPEVTYSHRSPPGEPIPHSTVYVFHAATGKRVRIDTRPDEDRYVNDLHWLADGSGLLLLRGDREQKRIDVLAADLETGATRVILTESSKTWVGPEPLASRGLTPLSGGRFLWASERDGWNQLYLYDRDGRLLRRLTAGEFPVVRVLRVDEKAGWVYFAARPDRERPYDTHLCRVDLEGRRFARLTEGTGQHGAAGIYELYPAGIDFSPSGEYFIDTHSDLDRPFAADLRAADGRLVRTLERADVSGLAALKWKPPEPFVVKAADGTTDIYGVLYKPYDFDPARKYPVLDHIYNAPWAMWVPKTFNSGHMTYTQALAQLGFVIVVVDGRGTPNRGKAFHDLIYGRQYRIEVPDHVAAIKQLARKRPYLDLTRVGIFGGSNGGYLAVRAALTEPDFFRAAAALAPPVDRASMAADFQEPYLGLPDRNPGAYAGLSLVPLAEKLKGKLLLAHGTADENVPFGGTMRLASALIEAGRDFDLLILPGQGHDPTGRSLELWQEKCRRHFQDYLRP